MNDIQICARYKTIYDHIIGELLEEVKIKGYDIKGEVEELRIPICRKIWDYEKKTKDKMKHGSKEEDKVLDRHKLVACLCAAIIEARPIKANIRYVNEMLATTVSLGYLRYKMIILMIDEKRCPSEKEDKMREYLRDNYILGYPDNLSDEEDYRLNMYHDLTETYEQCRYKEKSEPELENVCYHFDIFAYAKIFYHLERENRKGLEEMYDAYITEI